MSFFDAIWRRPPAAEKSASQPPQQVFAYGGEFGSISDPRLVEFLRDGRETHSGAVVSVEAALRNTTVYRCVSLISSTIGMLPLHLLHGDDFETDKASDHPLYSLLYAQPNDWQSAYDFRSLLQLNALVEGNGYARVIRSRGRVLRLVPMDPTAVDPVHNADWTVSYRFRQPGGGTVTLGPDEVFHLRGLSRDGIRGMALVKQAAEAIGLAMRTEEAAARLFKNGMLVGGALVHPKAITPEALKNLRNSLDARYASAENAHRWLLLEEGMEPKKFGESAVDSQHLETRKHQIEEIGRIFGVPRPLLGMDDTSWGSGIEELGLGFVRYGLLPWFTAWEQAVRRTLLVGDEKTALKAKFNEGALLRGSMKDQALYFSRALGSGGHYPWMHPDEVRALMNLAQRDDLPPPQGGRTGQTNDDPPTPRD